MFAVLSRGSSRSRNAYICSSCLGNVQPQIARLSRTTIANATFSTTNRCRQSEGETSDGAADAPNEIGQINENVRSRGKLGQGSRRRARRRETRRLMSDGTRTVPNPLSGYSENDGTATVSISESDETLAALRQAMLAEARYLDSRPLGSKKEHMAKEHGQNTSANSQQALSSLEEGLNVSKPPKSQHGLKAGNDETDTESKKTIPNSKGTSKSRRSPRGTSGAKESKPVDVKDGFGIQKTTVKGTASKVSSPAWAKKWIDAIADSQGEGSGFKRTMLLKLIENGNLSPKDVGPAVKLLRQAIQEDQTQREFQSFQQLPFQTLRQAMQVPIASDVQLPSGPRISRPFSKGNPMTPIKTRSKTGEKSGGKSTQSKAKLRGTTKHEIQAINASDLQLVPLDVGPLEVPKLSYGLERVLFNPGVYHLQDPRSRVFNFDPYLQTIMPVSEFDFNALKQYITSSRDTTLLDIAKAEKKKYTGSTSSMTSALAHFHFLLSQWRPINPGILSRTFPVEFSTFTMLQRSPTAIFLRYKDGTYAIDADKEFDTANILSSLGKSMEKLLTLPTNQFERYRKPNSDQISEEERNEDEAFHYTTMGDFLMRSQLDAYDPRLPGTGMFDLKTRAVVSIRMDTSKYEEGSGYEIRQRHGKWESFEREYYDMIRAAFLKYSLQVRMGRMDGIFVAFHNTERIFGFQYVSLPEMDYALHGTDDTATGDSEFKLSLDLLNRVLDRATAKFPEKSLRLFFETRAADTPFMYIFAEPVEETEINQIQSSNKAEIEEFESRVLGLEKEESDEESRQAEWDSLHSKVEETMDKDESGLVADEEEGTNDRRSGTKVWDEEERRKVEDFINAAAQEDVSEEVDDEDEDREDGEVVEGEEDEEDEEGDKDDAVVDGQDDNEDQENGINEDEEGEVDGNEILEESEFATAEELDLINEKSDDPSTDAAKTNDSLTESGFGPDAQGDHIEKQETTWVDGGLEENDPNQVQHALDETALDGKDRSDQENAAGLVPKDEIGDFSHDGSALSTPPAIPENPDDVPAANSEIKGDEDQIFAITLTIRNKVNGQYVQRPDGLTSADDWTVEYSLAEVKETVRARKLYSMAKERRSKSLKKSTTKNSSWNTEYVKSLMGLAKKGRNWRRKVDAEERDAPKKVLDVRDPGQGNGTKEE